MRGTEKGADCNKKSTFRDTRFSYCSLGLTKKPKMLFVILKFAKVDLNARLLKKKLFQKMPLKSKLKSPLSVYKHYKNEQGDLYDPRDTQEFAEKHSPGLK